MHHTPADLHDSFGGNSLGSVFGGGFVGHRYVAVRRVDCAKIDAGTVIDSVVFAGLQHRKASDGKAACLGILRPCLLIKVQLILGDFHCGRRTV